MSTPFDDWYCEMQRQQGMTQRRAWPKARPLIVGTARDGDRPSIVLLVNGPHGGELVWKANAS